MQLEQSVMRLPFKLAHEILVLPVAVSHLHKRGRSISFIYPVSIGLIRESKPSISDAGVMTANKTEKASTLMKFISQLERENNNK